MHDKTAPHGQWGFVVYSAGENGVDDGGQDDDEPGTGDVAFRMERGLGMSK